MFNDNEEFEKIDQDEIILKLEKLCNWDIVNSHQSIERKGASIDTEMVQHAEKTYVIGCC